jgi:hypothetical protein
MDPTTNVGFVLAHERAVELALLAQALHKNFRLLINE